MYKIEKNIPIPLTNYKKAIGSKYPFLQLKIGDSFFIKCDDNEKRAKQTTLIALSGRLSKEYKMKFTTRKVDGGVRVWRIKWQRKALSDIGGKI